MHYNNKTILKNVLVGLRDCVVWSIRKLFPEADGQYTRFKKGERDLLDAYSIYKT